MLTKQSFIDSFGSIRQAASDIGASRLTIYTWIGNGEIPSECTRGKSKGTNWHEKIKVLGFNPQDLTPL